MVNQTFQLDAMFHSLADPIRRDILYRLTELDLTVGELARKYDVSLVAISKHLKVLEKAKLISRRKEGRKHVVMLDPLSLKVAEDHLRRYQQMWTSRHDQLEKLLNERGHDGKN